MNKQNTNEPDGSLTNSKEYIYSHYFRYPENIDALYFLPNIKVGPGFNGRFVTKEDSLYETEKIIREIVYRVSNLKCSFFDMTDVRPDLLPGRKEEIEQIYNATNMMLNDVDEIKDIRTKKRVLYYFRGYANAISEYDFSKRLHELVALAARRNGLETSADLQFLITNDRKHLSRQEMTDLTNDLVKQTKFEVCFLEGDKHNSNVIIDLQTKLAEQQRQNKALADDIYKIKKEKEDSNFCLLVSQSKIEELKKSLQEVSEQNNKLQIKNAKMMRKSDYNAKTFLNEFKGKDWQK